MSSSNCTQHVNSKFQSFSSKIDLEVSVFSTIPFANNKAGIDEPTLLHFRVIFHLEIYPYLMLIKHNFLHDLIGQEALLKLYVVHQQQYPSFAAKLT